MYLKMYDNSYFGEFMEKDFGCSREKIVFIDDNILEKLDCNFLYSFKTILRKNEFKYIKQFKRKPIGDFKELDFYNWANNDDKHSLGYNYKYDYFKSLEILEKIYEREVA